MSFTSGPSHAAEHFTELINTLELRLYGHPPDEPALTAMEKLELYSTFEYNVRFFPDLPDFQNFSVPGKTHDDFLIQWKELEDIVSEMPGADEDIVPMWREMTEEWWEENREVIKVAVEEIKGAKVHAFDQ